MSGSTSSHDMGLAAGSPGEQGVHKSLTMTSGSSREGPDAFKGVRKKEREIERENRKGRRSEKRTEKKKEQEKR